MLIIETEYKYLTNKEQFEELLSKCNKLYDFVGRQLQANYYYDTVDNTFNKSKITIRVRQHQDKLKLQMKRHRAEENAMIVSDEYSSRIDGLPFSMKIPESEEFVYLKGSLITERITYTCGKDIIICLDTNMYLGICDYEIEIEVNKGGDTEALSLIECLGLQQKPIINKSVRFFKKLEAMQ